MPHFVAHHDTESDPDRPRFRLSIRRSEHGEELIGIVITREHQLEDFASARIPAYYLFEDAQAAVPGNAAVDPPVPPRPELPAKLTLVVAPGVSVLLTGVDLIRRPPPDLPLIDIYRVQDPHLVPSIGTAFAPNFVTTPFSVNTRPHVLVGPSVPGETGTTAGFYDSRTASEAQTETYYSPMVVRTWPVITRFDPVESFLDALPWRLGDASEPEPSATPSSGARTVYLEPPTHIDIRRTMHGIRFTHPHSTQTLELTVSQYSLWTTPTSRRTDHRQRFAYEIRHDSAHGLPRVTVVKTADVQATLTMDLDLAITDESRADYQTRILAPVFTVKEADFDDIPAQGFPLPTTGLRDITLPAILPAWVTWGQMFIDLSIGFIPILGDAADITEFAYAMMNGRDRWGREVSGWEKALMGVGAVITLIGPSISVLRTVPGLLGRNTRAVERVHSAIQAAGFTADEQRVLADGAAALARGERVADDVLESLRALLRRIPRCTA